MMPIQLRARGARTVRIAALAVALGASAPACGSQTAAGVDRPANADAASAPRVGTAQAVARTLPAALTLNGTLVADQQSEVTGIVPGRVVAVLVERGAVVAEGAPLVRLRDTDYRLQQAAARAALAQAQARLGTDVHRAREGDTADVRAAAAQRDLADETLRRAEQLFASGAASQADLDRARAGATAAREQLNAAMQGARGAVAALSSAQVALRQANNAVRDSVVRAPFAGEIADRHVDVGEFVAPQMRVVTLVRTDPLRLEIQVPQERIGAVRVGQSVSVRVDAFPDRVFEGTVRYISAAVRADTRTLTVEATIPNADRSLRPGLFATARLDLGTTRAAVAIPARAVLSEAGSHRAFVVRGSRVEERVIRIVDRAGDLVIVGEGLAAGERVATERVDRLSDGQVVQVR
ncbi:MAG: efflux RND transporter periplasmic adaptor subunit [Deltaproteobacteria bacterium]|nr:efflux RND transporter periplasmic adaptor subunit [Deltaproteobacteria bacterium]